MIRLLKLLNAPCRDIAALASRAQDERLTWSERFALRTHLFYCKACRRYRRQLALIRKVLAGAAGASDDAEPVAAPITVTLTPEARTRIEDAVRQATPDA
ncbi:MAG: zf-HC2 domain-containing protein [Phycisphaerales bacterium]|nr:zf-HC2 domain-containing protein [Phycisphaerales bacterium]